MADFSLAPELRREILRDHLGVEGIPEIRRPSSSVRNIPSIRGREICAIEPELRRGFAIGAGEVLREVGKGLVVFDGRTGVG